MQFKLKKYQEIENELLTKKTTVQNFSKSIHFPFPKNYKYIITHIKTTEISVDCIIYNSVEAANETKEFVDTTFWCFAGDGQGNRWLFDEAGQVFYYNHEYDEGFETLEISFEQWLQMANLAQQMDAYLALETVPKSVKNEFKTILNEIHPNLSKNFPYLI